MHQYSEESKGLLFAGGLACGEGVGKDESVLRFQIICCQAAFANAVSHINPGVPVIQWKAKLSLSLHGQRPLSKDRRKLISLQIHP